MTGSDGVPDVCPVCGEDYIARDYCNPPNGEPFLNFTHEREKIAEGHYRVTDSCDHPLDDDENNRNEEE